MTLYGKFNSWKYHEYYKKEIYYCYKINAQLFFIHNYYFNNDKNRIGTYYYDVFFKHSFFNLPEPNKKIASFYEALNSINLLQLSDDLDVVNIKEIPLYGIINNKNIYFRGGEQDHDNWHIKELKNGEIELFGENIMGEQSFLLPYLNGTTTISKKEFYLLMQLYYGLYQEEELFKQLENNEKNGKYDDIKIILNNYYIENGDFIDWERIYHDEMDKKIFLDENLLEEYLKLELMRKDISGALDGIKIEKIFDKDWNKEKQLEVVKKVNNEFGEEILVFE